MVTEKWTGSHCYRNPTLQDAPNQITERIADKYLAAELNQHSTMALKKYQHLDEYVSSKIMQNEKIKA